MKKIKRIAALASVFMLTTVTNIFAETGVKPAPKVKFSEIVLGVGVGLFVAYRYLKHSEKGRIQNQACTTTKGQRFLLCRLRKRRKRKNNWVIRIG